MNLETIFRFWPVSIVGVLDGWAYGNYVSGEFLSYRELLEKRRLNRRRRYRRPISDEQVEEAFDYHEALGVALEGRRILRETREIDEAQFSTVTLVSKEKAKEALEAFVNLKDGDQAAAVSYINKFGEFDFLECGKDGFAASGIPHSIQDFSKDSARKRQEPFAVSLDYFWAVRNDIEGLWNLARAVDQTDPQRLRVECIRRRPDDDFDPQPNWLALGKAILCADLSSGLNSNQLNPRVILSEKEGSLVASTMAMTVRSGLYLTLIDGIASQAQYKTCPNCNEHFIATTKTKKFCTDICQNAAKVRRFRNKGNSITIAGVPNLPKRQRTNK